MVFKRKMRASIRKLVLLTALVISCKSISAYRVLDNESLLSIANLSFESSATSDSILDYRKPQSLLAKMLIPRAVGSANLQKVQDLIRSHFVSLSKSIPASSSLSRPAFTTWEAFEDTFDADTPYGPKTFTNLVYTHNALAKRKLVIAAHTDSKFFPSAPQNAFVGATDSAVPCGLMLELASALTPMMDSQVNSFQAHDLPRNELDTTLQLIFFDGEEAFKQWTNTDSIYGAKQVYSCDLGDVQKSDLIPYYFSAGILPNSGRFHLELLLQSVSSGVFCQKWTL